MKKSILATSILCLAFSALQAQGFSYGILVGANYCSIEREGEGIYAGDAYSPFNQKGFPLNIGGFVDYGFNESIGLKTNIFYSRNVSEYIIATSTYNAGELDLITSSVHVQPMLKFDVNKEYNKGFYLLLGARMTFVINQEDARNNFNIKDDFYKKTNFGGNLGFGFALSRVLGFEIIGDYGFSNLIDDENIETTTAGAYINIYLRLDQIFQ